MKRIAVYFTLLCFSFSLWAQESKTALSNVDVELDEVIVSDNSFNLEKFMKKTARTYDQNKRKDPHIALGHYREKAKYDKEYVMFTESIGYNVYAGLRKQEVESGYIFFCENTRRSERKDNWFQFAKSSPEGEKYSDVLSCNSSMVGRLFRIDKYGPVSRKYYKNYTYRLDSSYFENHQKLYCISFEKNNEKGNLHIFADNYRLKSLNYTSKLGKSYLLQKKVNEIIDISYTYTNDVPYINSIKSFYELDGLEYWNEYNLLEQKYDEFSLKADEIWGLIYYKMLPFVEYRPQRWDSFNIMPDMDYLNIRNQLKTPSKTLEEQFIANSGEWWLPEYEKFWQMGGSTREYNGTMDRGPRLIKQLKRFF